MNSGDVKMVDAGPPAVASINVFSNLITQARQLIHQGKPTEALGALLKAIKLQGGDAAVAETVNRARELFVNKIKTNAAADDLASLLAECAIAEDMASKTEHGMDIDEHLGTSSILAETGRTQIVQDASSDGSSFVCSDCGDLVSNLRKDEHFAYWCRKIS